MSDPIVLGVFCVDSGRGNGAASKMLVIQDVISRGSGQRWKEGGTFFGKNHNKKWGKNASGKLKSRDKESATTLFAP